MLCLAICSLQFFAVEMQRDCYSNESPDQPHCFRLRMTSMRPLYLVEPMLNMFLVNNSEPHPKTTAATVVQSGDPVRTGT